MKEPMKIDVLIESRALPDGKGGLFLDGVLVRAFDSEAESDTAVIAAVRHMTIDGLIEQNGQAYKDGKPFELFDMSIK